MSIEIKAQDAVTGEWKDWNDPTLVIKPTADWGSGELDWSRQVRETRESVQLLLQKVEALQEEIAAIRRDMAG
jgi:hypothetical protein